MISSTIRVYFYLLAIIITIILALDFFYSYSQQKNEAIVNIEKLWQNMKVELDHPNVNLLNDSNQLVFLNELSWPQDTIFQLKQTGYLILSDSNGENLFHGYLPKTDRVFITPITVSLEAHYHGVWMVSFYAAVALGIFFWFRPIIRDVLKLQQQALNFSRDKTVIESSLTENSLLHPVSEALHTMSQRIQKLMGLQRDIATYVSHDIRTPLSRIRFAIENITDSELKQSIREEISEVEGLVSEILQYAQFEHEHPSIIIRKIDLHEFIQSLINQYSAISNISLNNNISPATWVYVDSKLFKRAVENLMNNALRYANSTINVSFQCDDSKNCLSIEDDGPGINTGQMTNLTSPFKRLDQQDNNENFGLGLAIVETICVWHKGVLNLTNSDTLGGAKFEIVWQDNNIKRS